MPSANDFSTEALQLLNVIQPGESPSSEDGQRGFDVLNRWMDWLGTQRQSIYFLTRTATTLVSGTASYTVGSGGTINIARPVFLEQGMVKLIIDTSVAATDRTEVDLRVLTDGEYAAWPQKSQQSSPAAAVWFDYNWSSGLARIYPLPIPDVGTTQLVIYTPTALIEFADQSTAYTFPPGYERTIVLNLAKELVPYYAAGVAPQNLDQMARESLADVKRVNVRLDHVVIDRTLSRRGALMTESRFLGGYF